MIDRWLRFWFAPAGALNLGVSRALFFAGVFLMYIGEDYRAWSTVSSAYWIPMPLFAALHLEPLGTAAMQSVQLIWRVALVFSALGILSRVSMIVAFVLGTYLLGLPHNFGQTYHFDALLVIAMGILACSRAGDAFSIDAWLVNEEAPARSSEYTWPIRAIWVAMSLVFFAAGLAKLRYGGLAWVTSQNMSILLTRAAYHVSDADPLTRAGLRIAQSHALSSAAGGVGRGDRSRVSARAREPQGARGARAGGVRHAHRHPRPDGADLRRVPRRERLLGAVELRRGARRRMGPRDASVGERRLDAPGIDPPDGAGLEIRQPYRSEADPHRVAAFAMELLDDGVGGRIDPRQRKLERGHPDRSFADRDVAAGSGNADLDRRRHLVRFRIDARHAAVALIERPHSAGAGRDEPRRRSHLDRLDDEVGVRIDAGDRAAFGARHPQRVFAESQSVRSGRQSDLSDNEIGRRIEAGERTLLIGHQPDAAGTGGHRAFRVADRRLHGRGHLVGLQIDPRHRAVAAVGHPQAAEGGGQTRARPCAGRDGRRRRYSSSGRSFATVPFGAFDTQAASSMANQSGAPAYGNTASGFNRSIGILTPAVFTPGFGGRVRLDCSERKQQGGGNSQHASVA